MAVANHHAVPALVSLGSQLGYVLVDFRLKRRSQHPAGALAHDLIDQGAVSHGGIVIHYGEHGRTLPTGTRNASLLGDHQRIIREGTPFVCPPELIHRS